MPIRFTCPNCNKKFQAKDEFAGRKMKCSGCGNVVRIPSAAPKRPERPPPAPKPADEYSIAEEGPSAEPAKAAPGQRPLAPGAKKKPKKAVSEYEISFEEEKKSEAAPAAGPSGGRICPGCKKEYPPSVKICVQCGINIVTGKKLQTEMVSAEPESTVPAVGTLLPGEEALEEEEEAEVGEEIPFHKLILNMLVNPIATMQMLFVYVSVKSTLYKMLGFYFGTLLLLGLTGIIQAELAEKGEEVAIRFGGSGLFQNLAEQGATISAGIALVATVLGNLVNLILWATVLSIAGIVFGAGGQKNFLATFIALAFVYAIGNCIELVMVGALGGLALVSPLLLLPFAFLLLAVSIYRAFLFVLAVKVVYDLSWIKAILLIVFAYLVVMFVIVMWLNTFLLFLFAPGAG